MSEPLALCGHPLRWQNESAIDPPWCVWCEASRQTRKADANLARAMANIVYAEQDGKSVALRVAAAIEKSGETG